MRYPNPCDAQNKCDNFPGTCCIRRVGIALGKNHSISERSCANQTRIKDGYTLQWKGDRPNLVERVNLEMTCPSQES